jgi:hypothetical protein
VTADFCAEGCDNEVALWRVTREEVRKDRVVRPDVPWSDVTATWSGPDVVTVEYRRAGDDTPQSVRLSLTDTLWRTAR